MAAKNKPSVQLQDQSDAAYDQIVKKAAANILRIGGTGGMAASSELLGAYGIGGGGAGSALGNTGTTVLPSVAGSTTYAYNQIVGSNH